MLRISSSFPVDQVSNEHNETRIHHIGHRPQDNAHKGTVFGYNRLSFSHNPDTCTSSIIVIHQFLLRENMAA